MKNFQIMLLYWWQASLPSIPAYYIKMGSMHYQLNWMNSKTVMCIRMIYWRWQNVFQRITFFKFNSKVMLQVSDSAIKTRFASPYAYIFMDRVVNFWNHWSGYDTLMTSSLYGPMAKKQLKNYFFCWMTSTLTLNLFMKRVTSSWIFLTSLWS